jgi:nicotinamidase-related amidase
VVALETLPFGPLGDGTLFVCIDMQRVFLEPGEWYCPAGLEILPTVEKIAAAVADECVFTRFITAQTPQQAPGRWRHYYYRWQSVTRSIIGDAPMNLHQTLTAYATPERTFDKTVHDAFGSATFANWVKGKQPGALVLFGIETDVCVLATAMSAVDLGYRVVIVTDAVASADVQSHRACLEHLFPRFDQQIELADCDVVLAAWSRAHD